MLTALHANDRACAESSHKDDRGDVNARHYDASRVFDPSPRQEVRVSAHEVEIVLAGRIGADVAGALDGFSIDTSEPGITTIIGSVPDQAKLLGLLTMFDDLHIHVISVNPVDPA
jgi:hypothetical protein